MSKQSLALTQAQVQKLSPLQIQTIKLIELPVQDLEQRVRQELEENPVLDDAPEDIQIEEEDDYIPDYKTKVSNWGKDEKPTYDTFSVKESFNQSLLEQLDFRQVSDHEREIAGFIIGSLDDGGYLRRDLDSLVDDLAFRAGIESDREEVERILTDIIQEFEPAGVGARDLRECLMLQLKNATQTPQTVLAYRILRDDFDAFTSRHFKKILSRYDIDEDQLKAVMKRIARLNPAPGGQISDSYNDVAEQIIPDFVLSTKGEEVSFTMPRSNVPELRISRKYSDMLIKAGGSSEREQKETAHFIKSKIDSAKWFIEALKQRQNTLSKTMQSILDFQHDFFLSGDDCDLKPMILEDIAKATGFDISTISRVVNSKYIETPFGIYPLKYFFSEGLVNQNGEEVSTRELKKVLQEIVDNEDKLKPFTDEQLVKQLSDRGYNVARRTIAKYRDLLGIPLARLRRSI